MRRFWLRATGVLAAGAALSLAVSAGAASHRAAHKAPHKPAAERVATETLGSAGAWSAYIAHDRTGRVCYLSGQPQKSDAAGGSRHQPMAMVTHRPAEHITDVVSFVEGYPLKAGSAVTVTIGDRKFDLFTEGDSAWAKTSELDRTIVAALAKGTSAVVKGEPASGRMTTDTYSLDGFSKALALIDKACGVTRRGEAAPPRHRAARRHHAPAKTPKHTVRKPPSH